MTEPDLTLLLRASAKAVKDDPDAAQKQFHEIAERSAVRCESCGKAIRHRQGVDWCRDREMTGTELQRKIIGRGKTRHWKFAHAGRGIAAFDAQGNPVFVTPMSKGWPDLFGVNVKMKMALVIECKMETEDATDEQMEWLRAFNSVGIPAVICRPSDLRLGRVNAILEGR